MAVPLHAPCPQSQCQQGDPCADDGAGTGGLHGKCPRLSPAQHIRAQGSTRVSKEQPASVTGHSTGQIALLAEHTSCSVPDTQHTVSAQPLATSQLSSTLTQFHNQTRGWHTHPANISNVQCLARPTSVRPSNAASAFAARFVTMSPRMPSTLSSEQIWLTLTL